MREIKIKEYLKIVQNNKPKELKNGLVKTGANISKELANSLNISYSHLEPVIIEPENHGGEGDTMTKSEGKEIKTLLIFMKDELIKMSTEISKMKKDIFEMKADIVEIKADIVEMKKDIVEMKADIVEMKEDIVILKKDVAAMKNTPTMKAELKGEEHIPSWAQQLINTLQEKMII